MTSALDEFAPGGFPMLLDNSMIAAYKRCPHLFFREYLEHWKKSRLNPHLNFGAAYAKGLEVYRKAFFAEGKPAEQAQREAYVAATKCYGFDDPVTEKKT